MSHCIMYIVWLDGSEFNNRLPVNLQATNTDLQAMYYEGYEWEMTLPQSNMTLLIELTGVVTLIWTPLKYSHFLAGDSAVVSRLHSFENWLHKLVQDVYILRLDEFLYNQWMINVSEDWFRSVKASTKFLDWIKLQDAQHWELPSVVTADKSPRVSSLEEDGDATTR